MSLGKRLREAREARGLTLSELARRATVGAGTISRWENDAHEGKENSSIGAVAKLGQILAINLNWLVLGEGRRDLDAATSDQLHERSAAADQARREGIWSEAIRSRLADPVSEEEAQRGAAWWLLQIKAREEEMLEDAVRRVAARSTRRPATPTTPPPERSTRRPVHPRELGPNDAREMAVVERGGEADPSSDRTAPNQSGEVRRADIEAERERRRATGKAPTGR